MSITVWQWTRMHNTRSLKLKQLNWIFTLVLFHHLPWKSSSIIDHSDNYIYTHTDKHIYIYNIFMLILMLQCDSANMLSQQAVGLHVSVFQGLWRWAVWLSCPEGVSERGRGHSVHQANPWGSQLPPCQKNSPLWSQGLSRKVSATVYWTWSHFLVIWTLNMLLW